MSETGTPTPGADVVAPPEVEAKEAPKLSWGARIRRHAWTAAKRSAWVTVGATILMLAVVSRLRDKMHDELGPLGARVLEWGEMAQAFDPGPTQNDDTQRVLVLNGQQLEIVTRSVDGSMESILADLQATCRAGSGDARQNGGEGYFLCLEELGTLEWPERFAAFSESHDVADLGPVRYVYVSERRDGSGALLVSMQPLGSFVLDDLVPDPNRDVAGGDPTSVPRPDGSRRVLSAEERGQPYGITMYGDPRRSPEQMLAFYSDRVDRERFTLLDLRAAAAQIGEEYDERLLYFLDRSRPGGFVVLHVEETDATSPFRSYVTVMEAR